MNAWFRISQLVFKLLIAVCLFLVGAYIATEVSANWSLFATIAIIATVVITLVWFVGKFSAGNNADDEQDEE